MLTDELLRILTADPQRTGIFTDFDGTLSPIVPTPEEAFAIDGADEVLEHLAAGFGLVAIVTGRSLDDIRSRFNPVGVLVAGAYGRDRSDSSDRAAAPEAQAVWASADAGVRDLDGVRVEHKPTGVALHYRAAPDRHDDVVQLARELATMFGLEIRPGRRVIELIAPGPGKGEAIVQLMAEHGLTTAVMAGDDVADVEAVGVVRQRVPHVVAIGVSSDEAPAGLQDVSDIVVAGPADLVSVLRSLANASL